MAKRFLLAHNKVGKLLVFEGGAWINFAPQPDWLSPVGPFALGAPGSAVLGLPTGEIICCAYNGANDWWEHYSPSTGLWTKKLKGVDPGFVPYNLTGLIPTELWAVGGVKVHKYLAGAWALHWAGIGGSRAAIHQDATNSIWYLACGPFALYRCTDGTNWVNKTATVTANLGYTPQQLLGNGTGIWSDGLGNTYFLSDHYELFKWDGVNFVGLRTAAQTAANCGVVVGWMYRPYGFWGSVVGGVTYVWSLWCAAIAASTRKLIRWDSVSGVWSIVDSLPRDFGWAGGKLVVTHENSLDVSFAANWGIAPTLPYTRIATDGATFSEYSPGLSISSNLGLAIQYAGSAPYIDNRVPANGSTEISNTTTIDFDLLDVDGNLNESTVVITINGTIAYTGSLQQLGFLVTRTVVANGYHYSVKPITPFGYLSIVSITASCSDTDGHSYTVTYSFTTTFPPPPVQIINEDLVNISFPFKFAANGDLELTTFENSISNNMKACALIPIKSIPLKTKIGSTLPMQLFDPNDVTMQELISQSVFDSIYAYEKRVVINPDFTYTVDDDGNVVAIAVPYKYRNSNAGWKAAYVTGTKVI
jgi:hypothetical protein